MAFTDINPEISKDSRPFFSIAKIIAAVLIAFSVTFVFLLLYYKLKGVNITELLTATPEVLKRNDVKVEVLTYLGITSFGIFILSSFIYIYHFERKTFSALNVPDRLSLIPVVLTLLIVFTFMTVNSWIIVWNQDIVFPEFLKGFEEWSKEKEESAAQLIKAVTEMHSFAYFLACFAVVALVAGVGEELLFRGLLQNKLYAWFKNPHIAIFATGFIFSAIHFQFYGFVPRMLLGVLFGYLYYWSKNIWLPIFAHIVNNGFQVITLYLFHLKYVDYNIEESTKAPASVALPGLLITAGLLFSFWKFYKGKHVLQ